MKKQKAFIDDQKVELSDTDVELQIAARSLHTTKKDDSSSRLLLGNYTGVITYLDKALAIELDIK
jgi:hypothetical protein